MPPLPPLQQMNAGGAIPWLTRPKSSDSSSRRSNKSSGSDRSHDDVTQLINDFASNKDSLRSKVGRGEKSVLRPILKGRGSTPATRSPQQSRPTSTDRYTWKVGDIYPVIPGKLHFTCAAPKSPPSRLLRSSSSMVVVNSDLPKQYFSFCQDFGPNNLAIVIRFCEFLSARMASVESSNVQLVLRTSDEPRIRTNAAFLLAAYLVIEKNYSPEDAVAPFEAITPYPFRGYRDATNSPVTFEISILDCLQGLVKARSCGWFEPMKFNLKEYEYWDTPTNGDFHRVSPKFIAFKGPVERHVEQGEYCHEPAHYIRPFHNKGVSAVVRLCEPDGYDPKAFKNAGITHYDLFFEDCTVPSDAQVREFMDLVDSEPGVIAVHCKAGLGRTGTLIGAYMMRNHGFTAREAIAWLRLCRPGSVIGQQQHFLVALESRGWGNGLKLERESSTGSSASEACTHTSRDLHKREKLGWKLSPSSSSPGSGPSMPKASDLADQVSKGMILRAKAREGSDGDALRGALGGAPRQSWPANGASVKRASTSGGVRFGKFSSM